MLILVPFFAVAILFAVGVLIAAVGTIPLLHRMSLRQRLAASVKLLGMFAFVGGILFGLYATAMNLSYGGSTTNGKVENGLYFVGNHGNYTEVSKATWDYLLEIEHLASVCNLLVVAGIATFVLVGYLEKGRVVTNLADGFDVEDSSDQPTL